MNLIFNFSDSGCEPHSRSVSSVSASGDVSYKVIDSESPPYFVNTSRSLVYTTLGRTLILECRVRNLGNRAVCHNTILQPGSRLI